MVIKLVSYYTKPFFIVKFPENESGTIFQIEGMGNKNLINAGKNEIDFFPEPVTEFEQAIPQVGLLGPVEVYSNNSNNFNKSGISKDVYILNASPSPTKLPPIFIISKKFNSVSYSGDSGNFFEKSENIAPFISGFSFFPINLKGYEIKKVKFNKKEKSEMKENIKNLVKPIKFGDYEFLFKENKVFIKKDNKIFEIDLKIKPGTFKIFNESNHLTEINISNNKDFYQFIFFKNSQPYFLIRSNLMDFECKGNLFVHTWSTWWGADVVKTSEWQGSVPIFYPDDWISIKNNGINLWMAPQGNGTPMWIDKPQLGKKGLIKIHVQSIESKNPDLSGGGYHNQPYGKDTAMPWRNPLNWKQGKVKTIAVGLINSPNEGTLSREQTYNPIILTNHEGRYYWGKNYLNGEKVIVVCKTEKGESPDFYNATWFFYDFSGDLMSKYRFKNKGENKKPDEMIFYGRWQGFFQRGAMTEPEQKYPLCAFHDWTHRGKFFNGNYFYGGSLTDGWQQSKMSWNINFNQRIEDKFSDTLKALDFAHNNTWSISWGNDSSLAMDYGDTNPPLGIILSPSSGFFFNKFLYTYECSPGVWGFSGLATKVGNYWQYKGWWDEPQADLSIDNDASPEIHIECPIVLTGGKKSYGNIPLRGPHEKGKIIRYLVNRMTIDISNYHQGVPNDPYAPTFSRGRYFNMMISPKIFYTKEGFDRVPIYPAKEIVFKDPYGNKLATTAQYIPAHWNGLPLPGFEKNGKPRPWLYAWKWSMQQKWDVIGCTWSNVNCTNPEAMQIFIPSDASDIRFDCDVQPKQSKSFYIYYSPIDGNCHFKNANWGWHLSAVPPEIKNIQKQRIDENKYYQKRDKFKKYWWNIGFDIVQWMRDVDVGREPFGWYEAYFNMDNKNGFFDTYLLDKNNGPLFTKRIYYRNHKIYVIENNKYQSFNKNIDFKTESMALDNYKNAVALYKFSKANYKNRLMNTLKVTDGKPLLCTVGLISFLQKGNVWNNSKTGFSRIITSISRYMVGVKIINKENADFNKYKFIILPFSKIDKTKVNDILSEKLINYVKNGGDLMLIGPSDKSQIPLFNIISNPFGGTLTGILLKIDSGNDPTLAHPPAKFYPEFSTKMKGSGKILKGISKFYYDGFILKGNINNIFEYDGKELIGEKNYGKGEVYLVSGSKLISNFYTSYNDNKINADTMWMWRIEGYQGMSQIHEQPDNNILLDNFTKYLFKNEQIKD
ncbi:MAG: hypothetical protein M1135_02540 [Candidatus Omnitrophica bacterium]|nr:hypothetical protein [Candidatus Omnitrophota bacterium]